jgi:hypothetical protein
MRSHPKRTTRMFWELIDFKERADLSSDEMLMYVTLLRLGEREQAERLSEHTQRRRFRANAVHVTPASPASVCSTDAVSGAHQGRLRRRIPLSWPPRIITDS